MEPTPVPRAARPFILGDARLIAQARRGEQWALDELWGRWRHSMWSICRAMGSRPGEDRWLLSAVYGELPPAARAWEAHLCLSCLMGAHVFETVRRRLALPLPQGTAPRLPPAVRLPPAAEVLRRLSQVDPMDRLIYLCDLFFHCPVAETSEMLGLSVAQLRNARIRVAWSLVATPDS